MTDENVVIVDHKKTTYTLTRACFDIFDFKIGNMIIIYSKHIHNFYHFVKSGYVPTEIDEILMLAFILSNYKLKKQYHEKIIWPLVQRSTIINFVRMYEHLNKSESECLIFCIKHTLINKFTDEFITVINSVGISIDYNIDQSVLVLLFPEAYNRFFAGFMKILSTKKTQIVIVCKIIHILKKYLVEFMSKSSNPQKYIIYKNNLDQFITTAFKYIDIFHIGVNDATEILKHYDVFIPKYSKAMIILRNYIIMTYQKIDYQLLEITIERDSKLKQLLYRFITDLPERSYIQQMYFNTDKVAKYITTTDENGYEILIEAQIINKYLYICYALDQHQYDFNSFADQLEFIPNEICQIQLEIKIYEFDGMYSELFPGTLNLYLEPNKPTNTKIMINSNSGYIDFYGLLNLN